MISQTIHERALTSPDRAAIRYADATVSYQAFDQAIAAARGYFARIGMCGAGYVAIVDRNLLNAWVLALALRDLGLTTLALPSLEALAQLTLPGLRGAVGAENGTPIAPWQEIEAVCTTLGIPTLMVRLHDQPPLSLEAARGSFPVGGHILLTSGTTGDHKMVLVSPAADAHFLARAIDVMHFTSASVVSVFHFPLWTAVAHRWPAATWLAGGTVVIDQRPEVHLPLRHAVLTHAILTPGLLDAVLAAPPDAYVCQPNLHLSVTGGAMTRRQIEQARARVTPRLHSWLASTEAWGIALTPIRRYEDQQWQTLIGGRAVQVVGDDDRPLPAGQAGRLRIATAGGPVCYLNDQVTTRQFFHDGYFYPGDLAEFDDDGRLALKGRATDVINLGGTKISPLPIEERLVARLGVPQVCLFSLPNDDGEIDAHLVIECNTPLAQARLAEAVNVELQGFARAHYYYVQAFPRNAMGKVLRRELRAMIAASRGSAPTNGAVPPRL